MYEVYGHELCNHHLCILCLHIKTKITVSWLQSLFLLLWNGFEISSSQDNYQIRQKIKGEESKLQARQLMQRLILNVSQNLYIYRDEGLEKIRQTQIYTSRKRPYSVLKRRKQTSTTQRILPIVFILEFSSVLKKQSLFCFALYCEYL